MDDLISRKALLSKVAELRFRAEVKDRDGNVHNVTDLVRKCLTDLALDAPAVHYTPYTDIAPITEDRPPDGPYRGVLDVDSGVVTVEYPLPDLVEVVRCRDCRWYDPPHIVTDDGFRVNVSGIFPTETELRATFTGATYVGGRCDCPRFKVCCTAHNREDPEDYEDIVFLGNRTNIAVWANGRRRTYEHDICICTRLVPGRDVRGGRDGGAGRGER